MAATEDMDLEYVKDKGGATLTLQVINGRYYPTFPAHVIKTLSSLKIRSDDVILAGYLKAGTHWVWEILRMLLAGRTDVQLAEKDMCMIEQAEQSSLNAVPSPRVLNTHVLFHLLPSEAMHRRPKIVYLTRNPKDTAVSMYHHNRRLWEYYQYDGKFEDYLQLFVEGKVDYGSWFEHIASWSQALKEHPGLDIHEVNYEQLSQNPHTTIQDLALFLNLSPSQDLISQICEECALSKMKEKKAHFDLDSDGNAIMYRKGIVGDWKNHFTEELNTWFDGVYREKMATIHTDFHWRFDLDS
ncbi:Sulfotransferase 1C4 [Bulinus truncatus]|nr:Sulfotransferase 1C4 [Bulinus truncatus]